MQLIVRTKSFSAAVAVCSSPVRSVTKIHEQRLTGGRKACRVLRLKASGFGCSIFAQLNRVIRRAIFKFWIELSRDALQQLTVLYELIRTHPPTDRSHRPELYLTTQKETIENFAIFHRETSSNVQAMRRMESVASDVVQSNEHCPRVKGSHKT